MEKPDVAHAVQALVENFSELEAELSEDVYKALQPHIEKIGLEVTKLFDPNTDEALIKRMVKLLTQNQRLVPDRESLEELEEQLANNQEHVNRWIFRLAIREAIVEQPVANERIPAQPDTAVEQRVRFEDVRRAAYRNAFRAIPQGIQPGAVRMNGAGNFIIQDDVL